jgi:anti-sigma-K factor RskA
MTIDEITLLAYVDQQLSAAERERVEAALAHDEQLRDHMRALQASRLPYAGAFEHVDVTAQLPPLRPEIAARLAQLTRAAESSSTLPASALAPMFAANDAPGPSSSRNGWGRWVGFAGALAASFVLGMLVRPLLSAPPAQTAVVDGRNNQALQAPAWAHAVASYQAMYTRATVDGSAQTSAQAQAVLSSFSQDGQKVDPPKLPDLSSAGLAFKRAQRLTFDNQALLQLAYLPAGGKPTALCILKRAAETPNADLQTHQLHGLTVITWTRGPLAYVLATELTPNEAMSLGKRIQSGELPSI